MGGYDQGYEAGKRQAANSQPRDTRPPLVKAVVSEQYRREYGDGVKDGFRDEKFRQK